ncbi:MAG: CocE/NonD family hydrolase [Chloroflexi bacterium]|nr:CocE/NonD family hydrolase [Chloroflexota bacterium]
MSPRVRGRVNRRKSNNHFIEIHMVPTRDGLNLATDIHRPQVDGKPIEDPLPVLLQRTPYGRSSPARQEEAAFFTNNGYVTVVQDCRGRYDSEGGFTKYIDEGKDGYDTVEWLAQQPWCNGEVGTFGLSYAAHTQAALASLDPPHLSAMWLECGGFASAYHSGCRNGGAFELRQVTWAFREALESPEARSNPDTTKAALNKQDMREWFSRFPWKPGHSPLSWTPDYEAYLMEIWGNDTFDEYWQQVGLCAMAHYGPFADVPQVHQCSWYDPYAAGTIQNYTALSQLKASNVSLIMGPWTHGANSVTFAGNADFGRNSTLESTKEGSFNEQRLAFFDHWLKGADNNWADRSPVKLFMMGGGSGRRNPEGRLDHGGKWVEEQSWPPARVKETAMYLHRGGKLSIAMPQIEEHASMFRFDPENPVPTIGGNISSGLPIMEPGGFDQRESEDFFGCQEPYLPLASRPDVLVFQTDPLPENLEVTGPVTVNLWISSSAVDTDFTAKLIDVYPPCRDYPEGYALNLTDGVLRTKFRNSWSEPELMEPGEIYPITIELYPTSNLFAQGHRIRLDVSSSNFPRLDVNGNTGDNPALSPIRHVATNTVYHDYGRPSHLTLWMAAADC